MPLFFFLSKTIPRFHTKLFYERENGGESQDVKFISSRVCNYVRLTLLYVCDKYFQHWARFVFDSTAGITWKKVHTGNWREKFLILLFINIKRGGRLFPYYSNRPSFINHGTILPSNKKRSLISSSLRCANEAFHEIQRISPSRMIGPFTFFYHGLSFFYWIIKKFIRE